MNQDMNRAARRAAMKDRKRIGRREKRPITLDTVTLATARATISTPAEIEATMRPIRDAFKAMREGVGTEDQWAVLAGTLAVAMTIENQGVVRGYAGHLQEAERALHGIHDRAMDAGSWSPTPLYWQEIDALDEAVSLHKFQLENLSNGEIRRAYDKSAAVIRGKGGQVIDLRVTRQQSLVLDGAPA